MTEGYYSRQSFLGTDSETIYRGITAAIVGLGGGGSHIGQQLAHIGVGNFFLIDPDSIERPNLNRTIGARRLDGWFRTRKPCVSARLIKGVNPWARVRRIAHRWQDNAALLRSADVIFGCVDGFKERDELEAMARRYLIPYIDIGMDVHKVGQYYAISGQVIVSIPGQACMRCMRFLSESKLAEEARRYGAAGHNPQVVWPNGVLASVAVGAFVKIFTPWTPEPQTSTYLEYEGNAQTVQVSNRLYGINHLSCEHYPVTNVGDPFWQPQ